MLVGWEYLLILIFAVSAILVGILIGFIVFVVKDLREGLKKNKNNNY